ncbi:hypothetical protein FQR65_LT12387 [Abscondita terminalis]|nr:hypothetical protein FQR65_LT12387 [Abscondita terminalis]
MITMAAVKIGNFFRDNTIAEVARAEWRAVFDEYDTDGDGYINAIDMIRLIQNEGNEPYVTEKITQRLINIANNNRDDDLLNFNEFINLIQASEFRALFGNLVNKYVSAMIPRKAMKIRLDYNDKKRYCPPPLGMITISLSEIFLFFVNKSQQNTEGRGFVADRLIYDPERRYQVWRFLTYMFVHDGYFHLLFNLAIQLFLGIILELVNRWWRLLIIYFAGVTAGSLGASIVDPQTVLQGASGGVYAIFAAHIACILMNFREMDHPVPKLLMFSLIVVWDIGVAIYERHAGHVPVRASYVAHLSGAVAGLLVGINIVHNVRKTKKENVLWWISVMTYTVLMSIGIVWHIAGKDYFPTQVYDVT